MRAKASTGVPSLSVPTLMTFTSLNLSLLALFLLLNTRGTIEPDRERAVSSSLREAFRGGAETPQKLPASELPTLGGLGFTAVEKDDELIVEALMGSLFDGNEMNPDALPQLEKLADLIRTNSLEIEFDLLSGPELDFQKGVTIALTRSGTLRRYFQSVGIPAVVFRAGIERTGAPRVSFRMKRRGEK